MPCWNNLPWRRELNQMASGEPGAVQCDRQVSSVPKSRRGAGRLFLGQTRSWGGNLKRS